MLQYLIGQSKKKDATEAVSDATVHICNSSPVFILFFADNHIFIPCNEKLNQLFPNAVIIGCSSYLSMSHLSYTDGESLVLLAFLSGIEISGGMIDNLHQFSADIPSEKVSTHFNQISTSANTVCLEFCTQTPEGDNPALSMFGNLLKNTGIQLVGGTAARCGSSGDAYVSYGNTISKDACVYLFLHSCCGQIRIYKENIFLPTLKTFTATKVDEKCNILYELDHRPAAEVLAEALNITPDELSDQMWMHPLGRVINREIFITEAAQIIDNSAIRYYARIYANTKMVLLRPDNYLQVLDETMARILEDISSPSLSIVINCMSRTKLYKSEGELDKLFSRLSGNLGAYIGLSSFGEQLNFVHLNQTMLIAVFE